MFNRLPKAICMQCMISSCSVELVGFKSQLDSHLRLLRNIVDLPHRPGLNNSLDSGDCLQYMVVTTRMTWWPIGHIYFRTCRRDNGGHNILIYRMILLFYYFLVIGHFNDIINNISD